MLEKTKNPTFLDDATDYLRANGYSRSKSVSSTTLYFGKKNVSVIVSDDSIEAFRLIDGAPQGYQTFTGASFLNEFNLMLVLQAMGVVSLKSVAKEAAAVYHHSAKY